MFYFFVDLRVLTDVIYMTQNIPSTYTHKVLGLVTTKKKIHFTKSRSIFFHKTLVVLL